ncbi:MAG: hypothetical protein N2596_02440, partial [Syntrophorhabdaceae bacterium]|nr:hypothetical protein [Syntrophorhabdaceae bacterium]
MRKHAILIVVIAINLVIFSASISFCEIISATVIGTKDNRLFVAEDEDIIINAGKNSGIIKGDILPIYKKGHKHTMVDEIAKCVIVKTDEESSICHIIKSKIEIGKGDYIIIKRLTYSEPLLYPLIYTAMNEIVAPYENHRYIKIYLHHICDDKNNVTEFSELIREEILNVFNKKDRLLLDKTILNEYMNYQEHYFYSDIDRSKPERIYDLKKKMEQFGTDVVITGFYKIKNDSLMVKLFLVDKNWEDKSVTYFIP